MSRRRPNRRAAPPRARRRSEWSVAEPPRSTHAHPWRGGTGELTRYEDAHCPSGRVPRKADRDYSCLGLSVWMRDVLGETDHLKGFGQDAGIERRIVTGISVGCGCAEALAHDHVG